MRAMPLVLVSYGATPPTTPQGIGIPTPGSGSS